VASSAGWVAHRFAFDCLSRYARFHQLMNEPGRGEEGDGEAALTSGEAER
jgi:hypothetical protein